MIRDCWSWIQKRSRRLIIAISRLNHCTILFLAQCPCSNQTLTKCVRTFPRFLPPSLARYLFAQARTSVIFVSTLVRINLNEEETGKLQKDTRNVTKGFTVTASMGGRIGPMEKWRSRFFFLSFRIVTLSFFPFFLFFFFFFLLFSNFLIFSYRSNAI